MQDMREFELYGTVGAVVSACDSVKVFQEQYSTGCMLRRNEYMVD
jgi:hypothetical protein